jgi:hypothetical protein
MELNCLLNEECEGCYVKNPNQYSFCNIIESNIIPLNQVQSVKEDIWCCSECGQVAEANVLNKTKCKCGSNNFQLEECPF